MPIAVGDTLPQADLLKMGPDGPETVSLADHAKGKKLVVFAVPGAFTRTCTAAHMPSFIRTKDQFDAKGIDDVVCVSVNDPFVMQAWGESTGADEAGIAMISDPKVLVSTIFWSLLCHITCALFTKIRIPDWLLRVTESPVRFASTKQCVLTGFPRSGGQLPGIASFASL